MPVIISALMFSALHFRYHSIEEFLFTFLIGIVFAVHYRWYRNIGVLSNAHYYRPGFAAAARVYPGICTGTPHQAKGLAAATRIALLVFDIRWPAIVPAQAALSHLSNAVNVITISLSVIAVQPSVPVWSFSQIWINMHEPSPGTTLPAIMVHKQAPFVVIGIQVHMLVAVIVAFCRILAHNPIVVY